MPAPTPAPAPRRVRATRAGIAAALRRHAPATRTPPEEQPVDSDQAINDVQALLLQVSFAIMMVFMIAYFIFRTQASRKAEEQVLELERQRIAAALDSATHDAEARYGLAVLTTPGEDGIVIYNPEACIEDGRLTHAPQLRQAFCGGAANAARDFADVLTLRRTWMEDILGRAGLSVATLRPEHTEWLGGAVDARISQLRERVRNVQLLSAAKLQEFWAAHPQKLEDPAVQKLLDDFSHADEETRLLLAPEVAAALRAHCLSYLAREAEAPMLP